MASSPNFMALSRQRNSPQPNRPNASQSTPFDSKSLGGNRVWTCNYCNQKVTEGCPTISDVVKEELTKKHEAAEKQKAKQDEEAKRRQNYVSLPSGSDLKRQKRKRGTLESCFNVVDRDEVDKECARMMYASALPFSLVKNPYFRRFVSRLSNSWVVGYVPPTYNRLRTTLFLQEKTHKKDVTLCSDGWGDRQKRPLINVMAASRGNSMFLKSFDASGNTKDVEYVSSLFQEVLNQEGAENVSKYSHIFWTPCVVYSLNLALKSMCEPNANSSHYDACKWISSLMSDCDEITIFVLNHSKALIIFQKYSEHMLIKVAETRFASHVIMGQRLILVKNALEKMALDPNWKMFRKTYLESKADHVKECVISDRWWDKLEYFLSFTSPIYNMIRLADCDSSIEGREYDIWDTMIEEVREKIFKEEGENLLTETRWNKTNTPLHCMAHALVPKYYSESWLQSGTGIDPRVPSNEDNEVSLNRDKCLKKMFPNNDDFKKVYAEYGMFSGGLGFFAETHVAEARVNEEPLSWWANYGTSTPMLQALAFKLLSQPASSSCCERNWSAFGNIQSVKRNKLTSDRTEDLVYVHKNLRMLSRKSEENKKGPSRFWDVGGDSLNVDDDYCEAFANIFADDPSTERAFLNDEANEDDEANDDDEEVA
ncbi:hypothetical protein RND81_08G052600 [Saponaria officinalis]|uniref:Uncharacterized protein n=1 Tax=Saponaria officinalis TaxID=3572 RepID=A0AAW1J510_SAPOF